MNNKLKIAVGIGACVGYMGAHLMELGLIKLGFTVCLIGIMLFGGALGYDIGFSYKLILLERRIQKLEEAQ